MSLSTLYTNLTGQSEVVLNNTTLGDDGNLLYPLLPDFSPTEITITVSDGPTWANDDQQEFTINGNIKETLLGLTNPLVQFKAFSTGADVHFSIRIDTVSGWTIGVGFPNLERTELNLLAFNNPPYFLLSTRELSADHIETGLNFFGELTIGETLAKTVELVPGVDGTHIPVRGKISKTDDYQTFVLKGQLTSATQEVSLPGLLTFRFQQPDIALYASVFRNGQAVNISKRIECDVILKGSSDDTTVSLPLALALPTLVTGWQIMLQNGKNTPLDDFLEFLSLLGSAGQFDLKDLLSDSSGKLNEVQTIISNFELKSFYVEINGSLNSSPAFKSFSFQIGSVGTVWNIIADKLSVSDLTVFFKVDKKGDDYNTSGFINGGIKISEGLVINGLIPLPPGSGEWEFSARHSVALSNIDVLAKLTDGNSVSGLLPATFGDLSGIVLKELSLVYDPVGGKITHMQFAIITNGDWVIVEDQLELVSLYLSFSLDNGSTGWGLTGTVQGELIAGGVTIDAQILKNTRLSDWYFSLHANQVPLPTLSDLSRLTGGENALVDVFPGSLLKAQLYLNDPRLGFNITQKKLESFGFSLQTEEIDFGTVKIIQAGLDVDIVYGADREVKVYGSFAISDIDFFLQGAYLGDGGWQLTGSAGLQSPIPIGELIGKLAVKFGFTNTVPAPLEGLELSDVQLAYNTKTKDFSFSFDTLFSIGSKKVNSTVNIEVTHNNDSYIRRFSGVLRVGDLEFDLIFNETQDSDKIFIAAFENSAGKDESIRSLVELISDNEDILSASEGISFNVKNALLAIDKDVDTKILFGLDIGGGVDLSKLPVVGKSLSGGSKLRLVFRPLLSNQNFDAEEINKIKPLVPSGGYDLPNDVNARLEFNIQLLIGDKTINLDLPIGVDDVKDQPPSAEVPGTTTNQNSSGGAVSTVPQNSDGIKWFKVQKQLGPVAFRRVGVQFNNAKLTFLIDASLSLKNLNISLDGLFASSTINPIHPTFGLHGMGIDYKKDPLEIGGAFLRSTLTDPQGNPFDTYDGTAIIRTEKFALAALGSYAYYQGHPSMFIYAFVDVPLGGPAFFFVEGLAAGFGYNRRLVMPAIDKVDKFPLVAEAMDGVPGTTNDLGAEISKLHEVIPPAIGEYFFAVGVKFSSFKIIDSFALLSVSFGSGFRLNVLGLSNLVIPTPEAGSRAEPLAEVQMALSAVFDPGEGYLKVRAALTSASYVISRSCHLTGGFAFYSWFKDSTDGASAGDFVLTLGGYHPRFRVPAYYPRVSPLGLNWRVSSHIDIKGKLYFALVPSAVMAGGSLSATWHSGHIKAWFNVGADFIISWKPYFYDASMHVDMGVSYTYHFFGTHHISVDVGAGLHIWGPDFSGRAHVHLWIVSFTVSFGAGSSQEPPALSWDDFRKSFLPENHKWANTSFSGGLIKQAGTKENPIYIVNPREFRVETNSAIPITNSNHDLKDSNKAINIGSMKITGNSVTSTHDIKIKKGADDRTADFTFEPIKKHVPGALWGSQFRHAVTESDDQRLIKNVCTGFEIVGKPPIPSSETKEISSSQLLQDIENFGKSISYEANQNLGSDWLKTSGTRQKVIDDLETRDAVRNELLRSLGFEKSYHPDKEIADELLITGLI